jgi:hypothetical protein
MARLSLGIAVISAAACNAGPVPISLVFVGHDLALESSPGATAPRLVGTFDVLIRADEMLNASYAARDVFFVDHISLRGGGGAHSFWLPVVADPRPPYRIEPHGRAQVRFTVIDGVDGRPGQPLHDYYVNWMCDPAKKLTLEAYTFYEVEPDDGGSLWQPIQLGGCPPASGDAGSRDGAAPDGGP